jgi:pyridine nucleotide-disulfide oxidoreductase
VASSYYRRWIWRARAAQALKLELVDVTPVDRRNYHLFQPLLYQVATGSLSPGQISAPLRSVLSKQKNTGVLLSSVEDVDRDSKRVFPEDGAVLLYDSLIVATGSQTSYFGHNDWQEGAPGLKSVEEATTIRHKGPVCIRGCRTDCRSHSTPGAPLVSHEQELSVLLENMFTISVYCRRLGEHRRWSQNGHKTGVALQC